MSASPKRALALVFALLVPMALCSCLGQTARQAGRDLAGGAFDELDSYLASSRGQATLAAASARTIEAGTAKLSEGLASLNAKIDPTHNGEWALAIESGAVKLAQPYIDAGVAKGRDALEVKLAKIEAKEAAGTATVWDELAKAAILAALTGIATYQKGHRTGEDKGWKDANGTGNGATTKT